MKYKLSELIEVIDSKNPNWTEKRTSWFINSVRDKTSTNHNALTRSDRKAISELSDSGLEAYVGSLLGEKILDNANSASEQILSKAEQTRIEADNYSQEVTHNAQNSAQEIRLEAKTSIEQLLNEANVEAQQIRDDASIESREYLSSLNAARVVELYTKELPTEEALMRMPKKVLSDYAQIIGCDVDDEMNKQDIVETISNNYDGLEKDVIVVPDKSEQIKYLNQQKRELGLFENDLDAREEKCVDLESELQERKENIESDEKKVRLARIAGRFYWMIGGAIIAAGAVYGEYSGLTDVVDLTHLRG